MRDTPLPENDSVGKRGLRASMNIIDEWIDLPPENWVDIINDFIKDRDKNDSQRSERETE